MTPSVAEAGKPLSPWRSGIIVSLTNMRACGLISILHSAIGNVRAKSASCLLGVFVCASLSAVEGANAGIGDGTFLVAQRAIAAPAGAAGLCSKYRWACASSGQASISQSALLRLATSVNSQVNRQTRTIADQTQYGREEHWTLPTARGGDCEDLVLLKKKILIEHGVAPKNLLIATVLDRRLNSHAVLVLRTAKGDIILDNLNKDIRPWKKTGYTFLKLQNVASPGAWHAVLSGGIIKERPTATR